MDRKTLINKVSNLTDNINKKVRKFRNEGLGSFYEYTLNYNTAEFDKKINLTMESGYLTKSKQELNKLSDTELEKLYNKLHNVQTNEKYGTPSRFKATEKFQLEKTASSLKRLIGEEKFNKLKGNGNEVDVVVEFMKRKDEITNKRGLVYVSAQIANQMYLDLPDLTETEEQDSQRTVTLMERSRELMERNNKQMESRRKNGNR